MVYTYTNSSKQFINLKSACQTIFTTIHLHKTCKLIVKFFVLI